MSTAEARRHDLYNALTEFIGADRADTLMTYLPSQEGNDLATRSDLRALDERIGSVDRSLAARIDGLETLMTHRFDAMTQRLDRMFLTMAAGLIVIVGAFIAKGFF